MLSEVVLAAAAGAAGYGLFVVPTQWLKVERIQHTLGLGIRMIQISDLHVEKQRVSPERLAQIVEQERPDYLMLTGDFTRKLRHLPKLLPYLRALAAQGVPTYAVLGNHDYKLKSGVNTLTDLLERANIRVLRNESVHVGPFRLVGIDNFGTGHSRLRQAFRDVAPSDRVIVITHDPNVVPHIRRTFEYLMAGHFHGKQFNLPFLFRLKPKGELPSRGIYKGKHESPQGTYYISKGIGQAGVNARLFVRSEITIHDL